MPCLLIIDIKVGKETKDRCTEYIFNKTIEENFPNIKKEASNKFKRNTEHQIMRTTEETPHGT